MIAALIVWALAGAVFMGLAARRDRKIRHAFPDLIAGFIGGMPQLVPDGENFRSENEVKFRYGDEVWTICPMETDFASVPRIAVWLIPKFGKYTLAAFVHDYFCSIGIRNGEISPRQTDFIFREIMRLSKVTILMRWLMWVGVRFGALNNPIRRHEVSRDFYVMIPGAIFALPLLIPAAIGIIWGLLLFAVLQLPTSLFLHREKTTTGINVTT